MGKEWEGVMRKRSMHSQGTACEGPASPVQIASCDCEGCTPSTVRGRPAFPSCRDASDVRQRLAGAAASASWRCVSPCTSGVSQQKSRSPRLSWKNCSLLPACGLAAVCAPRTAEEVVTAALPCQLPNTMRYHQQLDIKLLIEMRVSRPSRVGHGHCILAPA
jgi:hypothetical protein